MKILKTALDARGKGDDMLDFLITFTKVLNPRKVHFLRCHCKDQLIVRNEIHSFFRGQEISFGEIAIF